MSLGEKGWETEHCWLLTVIVIVTLAFAGGADINYTHVWNRQWHPHARFHAVWQLFSHFAISLFVLFLLWRLPTGLTERSSLLLAVAVSASDSFGFLASTAVMPYYEGSLVAVPEYDINVFGLVPVALLFYAVSFGLQVYIVLNVICTGRTKRD